MWGSRRVGSSELNVTIRAAAEARAEGATDEAALLDQVAARQAFREGLSVRQLRKLERQAAENPR